MLSFSRINRNIRSIRRYRQILGVLIKYGFGQIVEQLNIDYYIELGRRIVTLGTASKGLERLTAAQRLRMAMEELGPTFIKLGQVLSTRPDLIPKDFAQEFIRLQDKVPPFDSKSVEQQLFLQLGRPLEDIFASFDSTPLAAASISQVHRARLQNGEDVVVKIQRPGIDTIIETDLDILMAFAYLVENHLPAGLVTDPIAVVREFRRVIRRELDFTREGRTIDRFAANFRNNEAVCIPRVYWEVTSPGVLTLSYIDGIKVNDFEALRRAEHDLQLIAQRGADAFLEQVLVHGLFHGDPHPGNILVLPGDVIGLLDFGMVGHIDETLRHQLVDLILAIVSRDAEQIINHLFYAGNLTEETDRRQLKRDLAEFIDDYYDSALQVIDAGRLVSEFIEILQRHHIKFPADLILLAKALVAMEGMGRQLDPEFNIIEHLRPFLLRMMRERLSPGHISRETRHLGQAYFNLLKTLPSDLKEFVDRINRNKFKIDLEHRGLEKLISDIDKSSNRLSFSLLIGAIIVGSSLIMLTEKGPQLFGYPVLGLLGYTFAGFLGFWLAIAILRSGRL
ncbi:AarF/ABC1/UbiB kinase family protein [Malonomonas rubra]|uniref:ABC1 kinase family protein n=1 Tax=Malonomonas rubra TaxID=57040 RepID=UPI0026F2E407|nr:AarF/ABC1/UbiB kinase family protein [Malonomonas rubra]